MFDTPKYSRTFFLISEDENDYDEDYDNCDHKNTVYDFDYDDTCKHEDFDNVTPVHEIAEYSNSKIFRSCCQKHAYLFEDSCDVNIVS